MNRKQEYFDRRWDKEDEWAVKTFGKGTSKPTSRRLIFREALHEAVGQAAFDALFRTPVTC